MRFGRSSTARLLILLTFHGSPPIYVAALAGLALLAGSAEAITTNHYFASGQYQWPSASANFKCDAYDGYSTNWCDTVIVDGGNHWLTPGFDFTRVSSIGSWKINTSVASHSTENLYGSASPGPVNSSNNYYSGWMWLSGYNLGQPGGMHASQFGSVASTTDKTCTATHEFGHIVSMLDHQTDTYVSIMRDGHQNRCGHRSGWPTVAPVSHDYDDVSCLYFQSGCP